MAHRRLAAAEIQPPTFAFNAENEAWAEREIQKYPPGRQASAVIPLLWRAQKQAGGWLPQKAIEAVGQRLGMPYIRVLEVATFYTMFALEPVGEHFVQLCGTVPCHCMGALELKAVLRRTIGEERHVTADGKLSWLEVECLGACCNAPMVQINEDYYEDLTPQILEKILGDLRAGRPVKPGPQQGRKSSEPAGTVKTLLDPSLYDGSQVGAWKKRFEEEDAKAKTEADSKAKAEATAATANAPANPAPAKPPSGRAEQTEKADTPAKRVKEGEAPVKAEERARASDPTSSTTASKPPAAPTTQAAAPALPVNDAPTDAARPSLAPIPAAGSPGAAKASAAVTSVSAPTGAPAALSGAWKPPLLTAPEGGKGDDLEQIWGVGPKLNELLHRLGVFHFRQIAEWSEENLAWIDHHLENFKGRPTRERWIAQCKVLAAGGPVEKAEAIGRGESDA